ncbi:MAG: Rhomboid family protein [Planctomycetes bacterium ADurb.Bin126]|nr:MAG: Rhomboid family protein [Planctomycetes bacterium ADurb.Bin126]HOD84764.1 rhomboid family intramembrane serine protease [Phycisphaerae bacterium]HQL73559.1 rhomboid family intramembrane serine protease [Phycisphaerae bacterium]
MLRCPQCKSSLETVSTPHGRRYDCRACGGKSVGLAVLRNQYRKDPFLGRLYQAARQGGRGAGRTCPHCGSRMRLVGFARPGQDDPVVLDICVGCQFLWFDAQELDQLRQALPPPAVEKHAELSPRAREAVARMALSREPVAVGEGHFAGPEQFWQWLPGLLGMPVEVDAPPVTRKPVLTWGLSLVMAVLYVLLMAMGQLEGAIDRWGFLPAHWSREGGLTLLSSFFLHAGLLHLVGNLYFFVIFGDNVEESLGTRGFLSLLLSAHLAGMLAHAAFDPRGNIPCVGASAGISGVIAYYSLLFPRARLAFLLRRWFFVLGWFRIRAVWALVLFVLLQLLGAWQQIGGFSHVSALAHLGGLIVGVVVGVVARSVQRQDSPIA